MTHASSTKYKLMAMDCASQTAVLDLCRHISNSVLPLTTQGWISLVLDHKEILTCIIVAWDQQN